MLHKIYDGISQGSEPRIGTGGYKFGTGAPNFLKKIFYTFGPQFVTYLAVEYFFLF